MKKQYKTVKHKFHQSLKDKMSQDRKIIYYLKVILKLCKLHTKESCAGISFTLKV